MFVKERTTKAERKALNEAYEQLLNDMSGDELQRETIRQLQHISKQLTTNNIELTRIRNNVIFWFWLSIIGAVLTLLVMFAS